MAYYRSMREIPLTEEPHASVIAALLPDPLDESPGADPVPNAAQAAHLAVCRQCRELLGTDVPSQSGAGEI